MRFDMILFWACLFSATAVAVFGVLIAGCLLIDAYDGRTMKLHPFVFMVPTMLVFLFFFCLAYCAADNVATHRKIIEKLREAQPATVLGEATDHEGPHFREWKGGEVSIQPAFVASILWGCAALQCLIAAPADNVSLMLGAALLVFTASLMTFSAINRYFRHYSHKSGEGGKEAK